MFQFGKFFWPLITGAQLVYRLPDIHKDPIDLNRNLIGKYEHYNVHFVPSMLGSLIENSAKFKAIMQIPNRVFVSGEALQQGITEIISEQLPKHELYNLYGPTEATIDVTHYDVSTKRQESR